MPYKDIIMMKEWYKKRARTKKYKAYQKQFRLENKEYFKLWADENAAKCRLATKKWRDKNKAHIAQKMREWRSKNPWAQSFAAARTRCTNRNSERYNRYGGRGIMFNLTIAEVKKIWFRDNASKMKKPSIDRIDNDGNYEYGNCRFIPMSENHMRRYAKS